MPRPAMRTFLFTDLRDYTLFIETRGDQAATKMLRAARRIVRDAVARHRGAEIKTEGDSFYVVFRSPSSAIRCAVDIQRAAAAHTGRHPDLAVRMGIGINTGEAVPHDKGYVGSAVIVATRLSTSAKPNQILVTDTVRSLVRTGAHAAMQDLGAWTLKGIAQPIRVYEVDPGSTTAARSLGPALPLPAMLASPARPTPGLVVCPELVQREAPLAALTQHIEAAANGEARIVALSGEGGIGKTRLAREVAGIAHREGMYVFGGRSHASGSPYEPIVAALRPYAHERGIEILRRLLGPLVAELRRLLPEIASSASDAGPEIPSDERRERFLRTIHLLLDDAAAQRPVLLVLEDFQDADEASRDLLRYLASTLHGGICILLMYRDEEVGPAHPLRGLLAELDRERRLARVSLAPLDLAGVERMTAALVSGRDTTALARAVYERSEGVPFYVEELLKTALDDPDAHPDRLALSRTIADSVRLRVSRLVGARGPGVADLLEAAAVAEVPLGYDLLLRLSDRDEAEAGADLAAAIEAQLLERPPSGELYQFRHALTREAVAAGIAPARRRRLHARVARAIEAEGGHASRAALLARHFAAAGDRSKALSYARQGAANATRVGAYATATDLLRDAVAMAAGTNDEVAVLEELAEALHAAGRAAEAESALTRARDVARTTEGVTTLARIDVRLAGVLQMLGRHSEAIAVAQRAVAALEAHPTEWLAEAVLTLARLEWTSGDADATVRLATRSLTIAEDVGSSRVKAGALALLGAGLARLRDPAGTGRLREAIDLAVRQGAAVEAADAYVELVRAERHVGRWEAARLAAEEGLRLARERGLEFVQSRLLSELTAVLITLGRYTDARAVAEQAVAIARPGTTAATTAQMTLALVLSWQGEPEPALALLERIEAEASGLDTDRRSLFLTTFARTLLGLGRLDEADRMAREAVALALAATPGGVGPTAFIVACDIAEARGDDRRLRELLTELDIGFRAERTSVIEVVRKEIAATLATAEMRDAADLFEDVAAAYSHLGVPVRAAYRTATAILARGRPGPALRRRLGEARGELIDRGALSYVKVIDAMVRRRGGGRARSQAHTGAVLNGDELEAALLIAHGATDARIAERLGIEAEAATRLVRSVMRKLGARSRAQVASWSIQRPPVAASPVTE